MVRSIRVAVDVGGTFTDILAVGEAHQVLANLKFPTTPSNPERAVLAGLRQLLRKVSPGSIALVVHATTLGANALLGQKGLKLPRTALVTTRGFRDVLEIGRQKRPELYNFFVTRRAPLVARQLRFELSERVGSDGHLEQSIRRTELRLLINNLRAARAQAIAVAFLNAYANASNEMLVAGALKRALLGCEVRTSHEVAAEYREYERMSTSVVAAILAPLIARYIASLTQGLRALQISAPLFIMQSNGGLIPAEAAETNPASLVESGPAAGAVGTAAVARQRGLGRAIAFDMGGTTAKAAVVGTEGPAITTEYEVGGRIHTGRLIRGTGHPIRLPVIDLSECGAGGGTIIRTGGSGELLVGPESAGADPGPVCYGRGGRHPTLTDAHLILGRLSPDHPLAGTVYLQRHLARKAFLRLAGAHRHSLPELALSALVLANNEMAKILRIVTVERGLDPRDFLLVAYGGAGPMHACALAEDLDIRQVVVPPVPGLHSAQGLLATDVRRYFVETLFATESTFDPAAVEEGFRRLEAEGREALSEAQVPPPRWRFFRLLDIRYIGQGYELTIPVRRPTTTTTWAEAVRAFHRQHRRQYGYAPTDPAEVVAARLLTVGHVAHRPGLITEEGPSHRPTALPRTRREVWFEPDVQRLSVPVWRRNDLKPVEEVEGPAVIEQYDATTLVPEDWLARVDATSNLVLQRTP